MFQRRRQVQQRSERWEREDASPRLATVVPNLMTLRLTTRETRDGGGAVPGTQVTRHVIVARAGAHFEFPCSDAKCEGGGYDLTREVISELRRLTTQFTADCTCNGLVGDRPCGQSLEVIAQAAFK